MTSRRERRDHGALSRRRFLLGEVGRVAMMRRRVSDAAPLLLRAARRLERFDRGAARDSYRDAFISAFLAGSLAGDTGLPEVAAAIRSAAPSAEPERDR